MSPAALDRSLPARAGSSPPPWLRAALAHVDELVAAASLASLEQLAGRLMNL